MEVVPVQFFLKNNFIRTLGAFLLKTEEQSQPQYEKNKQKNEQQPVQRIASNQQNFLGLFCIAIVDLSCSAHDLQQKTTFNQAKINLCHFILR